MKCIFNGRVLFKKGVNQQMPHSLLKVHVQPRRSALIQCALLTVLYVSVLDKSCLFFSH